MFMKKIITAVSILGVMLLLSGCESKVITKIVYVDLNGSVINTKPALKTFNREIECDTRGYAYYVENKNYTYESHTPILENLTYGAYQVLCEDIRK